MKLVAKQDFSWAHEHVRVVTYKAGDEIETDDEDLISVARTEGWAVPDGEEEAPKRRAKGPAPENKAENTAPENK